MKKLLYATLITACSSLGLMSCFNGDYDANPDTNNSSVGNPLNTGGGSSDDCPSVNKAPVSATIGGAEFVAEASDPFTINQNVVVNGQNLLQIQGHAASFQGTETVVELLVGGYTGVKSYAIGGSIVGAVGPALNPQAQYSSAYGGSGQITVSRDDADTLAGSFYFTVKNSTGDTKKVCGGYFKMKK